MSSEERAAEHRIPQPGSLTFSGDSGRLAGSHLGQPGQAPEKKGNQNVSEAAQDHVIVFDTTLRDGEQSPGCSMNLGQKLRVARALAELGVDVIEAGFAAASPGDLEAIQAVGRQVPGPVICSLSRCTRGDIEASWKALQDAPRKRCHVFLATSPIHRDFKLKMAKEEIVKRAVEGVKMARE